MSSPATARRGVVSGEVGMLLAVVATLLRHEVVDYTWIAAGLIIGSAIGVPLAMLMPMTHVPQRTAISQACGALASALIGTAEYYRLKPHGFTMGALALEMLLGFLTTTASLMAFGKLHEVLAFAADYVQGTEHLQSGDSGSGGGAGRRAGGASRR